ncbi:MAG: hypothetical protein ACRDJC_24040 [Thermomicrobiales bacterium]
MDGSRFDAWTRRQVGLVAGGLAGSFLGLVGLESAEAKKRNKKKKKKRCKKLTQACTQGKKKRCCNNRRCGRPLASTGKDRCCRAGGESCSPETAGECCTGFCLGAGECFCKSGGTTCNRDAQCCSNDCDNGNCAPM